MCCVLGDLAEGVGLSVAVEVVSEPLAERQQHDLDGQTEGGGLGRRGGWRSRLDRGDTLTRGQSPLGNEIITARGR